MGRLFWKWSRWGDPNPWWEIPLKTAWYHRVTDLLQFLGNPNMLPITVITVILRISGQFCEASGSTLWRSSGASVGRFPAIASCASCCHGLWVSYMARAEVATCDLATKLPCLGWMQVSWVVVVFLGALLICQIWKIHLWDFELQSQNGGQVGCFCVSFLPKRKINARYLIFVYIYINIYIYYTYLNMRVDIICPYTCKHY